MIKKLREPTIVLEPTISLNNNYRITENKGYQIIK